MQATDRQQEIADHILQALSTGGKTGGEIVQACREHFSPSEVGPTLSTMLRVGSVSLMESYYYKSHPAQRRFR